MELFDNLIARQDKIELIEEFEKVIARKVARNIETAKPPVSNENSKGRPKGVKRKDILIEILEKQEAKRAKKQQQEEKKKKIDEER